MQRLLGSIFVFSLMLLSFSAAYSQTIAAGPAGAGESGGATLARVPNAVNASTTTSTVTSTVTQTVTSIGKVTIVVHVVDQNGLWIDGAEVEVFLQQSGLVLVSTGVTANGQFFARNLQTLSTYEVRVSAPTGGTGDQTVSVQNNDAILTFVIPIPSRPILALQSVSLSPGPAGPSSSLSLSATVVNLSNSTAYNAVLSITPPPQFSLLNTGSVIPVGTLAPGASKALTLSLSVSSATTTSGYAMPYLISFTDYFLNKLSDSGNLFIPVAGSPVHPNLIVTSAAFSSQVIHPGDSFAVQLKIENVGLSPALQAVLAVNATNPITAVGSAGNYRFGNVGPNGTIAQSFSFSSPSSTRPGSYSLAMTLSYVDNLGAVYSTQQTLAVNLVGEPTIVFNVLQFGKNPLTPGIQTFLNAQLFNSGGASALGVRVSFAGGPAFLANTTIYLGSIQVGVTGNATAYLSIPANTKVGDYNFNATVSYSDSNGGSYTVTSPYTVTVAPYATPNVSITNTLLSPAVLNPGTQGTFTMYLRNDGSTPAYNTTVSMQNGHGIFTSLLFGLGTLDGLTSSTTVTGVNVNSDLQPGNYLVKILVSYTDQNNVHYNFTLPMQLTVYATSSLLTFKNVGFGVGAVLVVMVGYFVLRRYLGTRRS